MGYNNSEILKAMRLMHDTPKYWILSSRAILVGSKKDGTPIFSPNTESVKNKIVLTIPENDPTSLYEWVAMKCSDGYYRWKYTGSCNNTLDLSDLSKEYDNQHADIERMRSDINKFHEQQKQQSERNDYSWNWEWITHTTGLSSGSDAGHFQLDYKQAEINNRIFNNASTENIGHDKEDIDKILSKSTVSAVESSSISQKLKYMKVKQDKYGTKSMTQNITITGDNNTVIGISMNQTGKDDCEQTQTVVIKNSKSKKKKEKRETVFGVLHHALINLAKIVELSTQYLLEYVRDIFFG